MTTNEPQPGPPGRPANPTWLGQVRDEDYRQAPSNPDGRFQPALRPGPLPVRDGRSTAGALGLVLAGGLVAFAGLFLVLPFLLARTGVRGSSSDSWRR